MVQFHWVLYLFCLQLVNFTHEAPLPAGYNDSPNVIERAMLIGLQMGLAHEARDYTVDKKRSAERGQLWFGPRLGRKKRSYDDFYSDDLKSDTKLNELGDEENDELEEYLKTSPWAIIPLRAKESEEIRRRSNDKRRADPLSPPNRNRRSTPSSEFSTKPACITATILDGGCEIPSKNTIGTGK